MKQSFLIFSSIFYYSLTGLYSQGISFTNHATITQKSGIISTSRITGNGNWMADSASAVLFSGNNTAEVSLHGDSCLQFGHIIKSNNGDLVVLVPVICNSVSWNSSGHIRIDSSLRITSHRDTVVSGFSETSFFETGQNAFLIMHNYRDSVTFPVGNNFTYAPLVFRNASLYDESPIWVNVSHQEYSYEIVSNISCDSLYQPEVFIQKDSLQWKIIVPDSAQYDVDCFIYSSLDVSRTTAYTLLDSIHWSVHNNSRCADSFYQGPHQFMIVAPLAVILPVTGLEIQAYPNGDNVIDVVWKTVTEINSYGFSVQRSQNGVDFSEIGFMYAKGSLDHGAEYIVHDHEAEQNIRYYYRIESHDNDGVLHYSRIVSAQLTSNLFQVTVVNLLGQTVLRGVTYDKDVFVQSLMKNSSNQVLVVIFYDEAGNATAQKILGKVF